MIIVEQLVVSFADPLYLYFSYKNLVKDALNIIYSGLFLDNNPPISINNNCECKCCKSIHTYPLAILKRRLHYSPYIIRVSIRDWFCVYKYYFRLITLEYSAVITANVIARTRTGFAYMHSASRYKMETTEVVVCDNVHVETQDRYHTMHNRWILSYVG